MTKNGPRPVRRPLSVSRHVFMALVLTAAVACEKKAPPPRSTPVVAVAKANRGPLPYVVNAPGQVEPARTVSVQSQVSGMLTRVAFEEGADVTQGQILFEVDARPFKAELARVNSTLARDSANYAQAMLTVDRYAALAKTGAASREQMDQLNATAAALAGTLAADRASVDAAKLAVEQSTIRAPISGRTGLLAIRAGNLVRASSEPALVTINEVRPVMVKFAIPERDFAEMRKRAGTGKALDVMIRPSTSSDSSKAIIGKLAVVDNNIDQATGAITLKARVGNQDGALWPGQFVKLGLELSVDSNAITVPTQAVVTAQTGQFIYVLDGENKAKRHPVKVGRTTGLLSVIDSGLVGGETVITDGQTRLNDGAKVEIRTLNGRGGGRGDANRTRSVSDSAGGKKRSGNDSTGGNMRSGNDSTGGKTRGDSGDASGAGRGRGKGRGRGGN